MEFGKVWGLGLVIVSVLICVGFSQDHPNYSSDDLPRTRFSCQNKVHGGYYADIETDCQMYHVCARNKDGRMRSTKFLCGNGTVFDQRHLVCQDYRRVQHCRESRKYYRHVATLLQKLEARAKTEGRDREIVAAPQFHYLQDAPMYSSDDMPRTRFSCKNKVQGGYYADIEADCQMYHICARNKDGKMRSTKFLCGNGTVFDQRHLVCQDFKRVPCQESRKYYRNVATILEELEARLEKEGKLGEIMRSAQFDSERE